MADASVFSALGLPPGRQMLGQLNGAQPPCPAPQERAGAGVLDDRLSCHPVQTGSLLGRLTVQVCKWPGVRGVTWPTPDTASSGSWSSAASRPLSRSYGGGSEQSLTQGNRGRLSSEKGGSGHWEGPSPGRMRARPGPAGGLLSSLHPAASGMGSLGPSWPRV